MYSKYLQTLVKKKVMVQISLGEDNIVFSECYVDHIDKDVVKLSVPKANKTYFFNTSDIAVIGIGDFELTKKGEVNQSGYA